MKSQELVIGYLCGVSVDSGSDISNVYAASIFRVNLEDGGIMNLSSVWNAAHILAHNV